MQKVINYYRYINILSLDVAVGATISALFLTRLFAVNIRFQGLLCLGLTVWLIYTADHLLDAKMMKNEASTLRHRFHQHHFKLILLLALMVFVFTMPLLFFIYRPVLIMGAGLALLVLLYFVVQRKLGLFKELLGAVLYCFGVMLPVIALSKMSFDVILSIPFVLFFNTALINLILFSWFDREKDLADNHSSIVTKLGSTSAKGLLYLLFFFQLAILLYAYQLGIQHTAMVVFLLMNIILLFIFLLDDWFSANDRYRLAGDAVFLIPLIYIVL